MGMSGTARRRAVPFFLAYLLFLQAGQVDASGATAWQEQREFSVLPDTVRGWRSAITPRHGDLGDTGVSLTTPASF
jgi:hypothetical protein